MPASCRARRARLHYVEREDPGGRAPPAARHHDHHAAAELRHATTHVPQDPHSRAPCTPTPPVAKPPAHDHHRTSNGNLPGSLDNHLLTLVMRALARQLASIRGRTDEADLGRADGSCAVRPGVARNAGAAGMLPGFTATGAGRLGPSPSRSAISAARGDFSWPCVIDCAWQGPRGALLLLIGQQIVCAGLQGAARVSPKRAMGGREFAQALRLGLPGVTMGQHA